MNRIAIFEGYSAAPGAASPGQLRVQKRFKRCATTCRKRRGGKYPSCMRTCLRTKNSTATTKRRRPPRR